MIDVAVAVLWKADHILICQRQEGGSCSLCWEFPGGKLEPGETLEECAIRECKEELGVDVTLKSKYASQIYEYPEGVFRVTFFFGEIVGGDIVLHVHKDAKWVHHTKLNASELCAADIEVVEQLKRELL